MNAAAVHMVARPDFGPVRLSGRGGAGLPRPWTGLGLTAPTPKQLAEVETRDAANHALIGDLFAGRGPEERSRRGNHRESATPLTTATIVLTNVLNPGSSIGK